MVYTLKLHPKVTISVRFSIRLILCRSGYLLGLAGPNVWLIISNFRKIGDRVNPEIT